MNKNTGNNIGKPVNKVDNKIKISGKAKYIRDDIDDDVIYAKTLRSEHPRAKILSIKYPHMPEGYFIVDRNDISGKNIVKMILEDQPIFANEIVNYVGEPISLIVGPDKAKILEILGKVHVDYELMTPILTTEQSKSKSNGMIFGEDNCMTSFEFSKGNIENSFTEAYEIIEETYNTGYQEHIYIEPNALLASYENEKVTIKGSMQCPYYVKNAIVYSLGIPEYNVRVIQTITGGAFGGKEDYPSIIACQAAVAAIKSKRKVLIDFDRTEDIICTTKRHPSAISYKTALDESGNIMAMEIYIELNAGAYSGLSSVVLQRAMFASTGVYNIKNIKVKGRGYATNYVPSGAFRGFGCPQSIFAIELHMESIAKKLNMNPLDYKEKYLVKKGDETCTGGTFSFDVKLDELIEKANIMSDYRNKVELNKNQNGKIRKGIGVALFLHGCGFTGSGEQDIIKARVGIRKNMDGTVDILACNVDMGQGIATTFRKIAAKVLDKDVSKINYSLPDTDCVPDSGPTVASRTIMVVGRLIELCALELKERWNQKDTFEIYKDYRQPKHIKWDQEKLCGDAYPDYSWGINVVEVEVDTDTYEITMNKVWSVFDIGTVIDERIMRGQVEGGILQGLGYATCEVMEGVNGRIVQKNMTDYIIPTSKDTPVMETAFIFNPYDEGPFGAKGAGELTLVGSAAALTSAVQNALDINIYDIPIKSEYLMEEMG